jgi:hypothetical protein
MNVSVSVSRIALVVALAALVLAGPVSAVQAGPFHASFTLVVTFEQGNYFEGTHSGRARPGGPFTGTVAGQFHGGEYIGVATWEFGGGDTLTYEWQIEAFDAKSGLAVGTYVITGGTGRLADASGSGSLTTDGTGEFTLDGTLSH